MDQQIPPTRVAHLVESTFRDAEDYIERRHPELMGVSDPGFVRYHGCRAALWIDRDDPTVIVAAISNGPDIDIYRTTLSEFFGHSSYEPTGGRLT